MSLTIKFLDYLWRGVIKSGKDACEMCGATNKGFECAHIIGRGALWTRWHEKNGLLLCCGGCHNDAKIKAWLIAESHKKDSKYRWRWRWVQKQRRIIHRGRGPDLRNEYRRLKSKENAALKKAAA